MNNSVKDFDWRAAWAKNQDSRHEAGDASYWDGRAGEYCKHSGHSNYARTFLEFSDIAADSSVIDIGCGPGTLSLPLAQCVTGNYKVIAADFSNGMLAEVDKKKTELNLHNLTTKHIDWDKNWADLGYTKKSVDVAIASRSTMVKDLWDALEKLNWIAKEKVCITMTTAHSPKALERTGRQERIPDFIFGMNMLFQMGYEPQLRWIDSLKGENKQLIRWAFMSWQV